MIIVKLYIVLCVNYFHSEQSLTYPHCHSGWALEALRHKDDYTAKMLHKIRINIGFLGK